MPSPYDTLLKRPVWPKAHTVHLKEAYQGSSKSDLENEIADSHHIALHTSVNGHRRAGIHGHEQQDEETLLEVDSAKKSQLNSKERQEVLAILKDRQHPEQYQADFEKLLKDPKVVFSVRDLKAVTPDILLDEQVDLAHHGAARYLLPLSEDDIKNQVWQAKLDAEKQKKNEEKQTGGENGTSSNESGSGTEVKKKATQDGNSNTQNKHEDAESADKDSKSVEKDSQKKERDNKDNEETGPTADDLNEEEKIFMDNLIAESNAIAAFENNPGIPSEPEKGDQIEFHLQVDDQFTPDNWIPRSRHLLRLTGKHPLNAEPDMNHLFEAGMITPIKLHYVRNHGDVPKLQWEDHTLEVFSEPPGLVQKTLQLSMDEIAAMPAIEIPVTIACDGNRRGEVNMIKKSGGFSWSSAGVSTCKWKGVLVRDILLKSGLADQPVNEVWHLNYQGADEPSEGKYETSIPLAFAMDPTNDVMLAYKINGRVLDADHGYPLRSIIPGYVGGRQVKWLKKLWISKKPNESHYHIWDNRVLPSFVTSKTSVEGKALFHHPDTACNEQILQSIICKPAHDEELSLSNRTDSKTYRIEGFSYNGGGREVQRVELSLDGSKTWRYCFRKFLDKPLRHGKKHWAWNFWFCDVPLVDLLNARSIAVRAFDPAKMTQPENISWNLLGMNNNAIYRVQLSYATNKEGNFVLVAKHPVAPGCKEGGWMKPSESEQAKSEATENSSTTQKEFTLEDVAKHNKQDDAWIVLDGKIFDVTSVLSWHPGGASAILNYCGKATAQATADYNGIHDSYANKKRDECLIGKLSQKGVDALAKDSERVAKEMEGTRKARRDYQLSPYQFTPVKLLKRQEVSKDTRVYTFQMPEKDGKPGRLGLPVCRHVEVASHWKDGVVMRPYTPIRPVLPEEEDGTFDLLIKTYFPEESNFAPGGTLSNYLDMLKEGELVDIKGPTGDIEYSGKGVFRIDGKERHFEKVNLVAGGTGLTPHYQLVHAILKSENDQTQVSLIDSNKTIEDILLKHELEELASRYSAQFRLWHTLSKKPEDGKWEYSVGHLDDKMMQEHFFPADGDKVASFLCGPPGLIEKAAIPGLKKMGFKDGKTLFGF